MYHLKKSYSTYYKIHLHRIVPSVWFSGDRLDFPSCICKRFQTVWHVQVLYQTAMPRLKPCEGRYTDAETIA